MPFRFFGSVPLLPRLYRPPEYRERTPANTDFTAVGKPCRPPRREARTNGFFQILDNFTTYWFTSTYKTSEKVRNFLSQSSDVFQTMFRDLRHPPKIQGGKRTDSGTVETGGNSIRPSDRSANESLRMQAMTAVNGQASLPFPHHGPVRLPRFGTDIAVKMRRKQKTHI